MASNQELDSIEVDYKQHEVKYGDVFFTISSETAQDVGMSSVWPFKIRNVYLNSFCFGLRVNTKFNLRYLASILRSSVYRKQIVPLAQGISRFNISKNKVLKTVISVPPIREQECIGSLFRCLDSLIAAAERKVRLLRKKKHAYLNHIFTQHLRFTGHTTPWQTKKLGDIYTKAGSGGTPSTSIAKYYNGNIPFLSIADLHGRLIKTTQKMITEDGLLHSAAWIVPQGSIALAMYASVGKVGILSRPMATSQAFYNMVFTNDSTRNFIFTYLEEMDLQRKWEGLVSTGTQRNLNAGKIQNLVIQIPECNEQKQIARFFQTLDFLIAAAERKVSLLKKKKRAYLQRMFI